MSEQPKLSEAFDDAALVVGYFSAPDCGVCKTLRPKVEELLAENYPEAAFRYVNVENEPTLAATNNVFAVPTIILFAEGKETKRFARHLSVGELTEALDRYYGMLYD
ncbi:MAG: thioredoxin [Ignavibacteriales bacterium]|nr:thioredoxin [Ignavibacteriales bacterium]